MILKRFVDREKDKNRILAALSRQDCQFLVIYGRRRIGKSALIKQVHFALFTKVEPLHREGKTVFLPSDVIAKA